MMLLPELEARIAQAVREAAIERIRLAEARIAERGLRIRTGGELEFFPLDHNGQPGAKLLDAKGYCF